MKDFVYDQLIFMTIAGSRMYGTDTPESDVDKRGVCVPPKNSLLGFARNFEQQEVPGEDTVIYSLKKFMQLAVDSNPNIIELLFAPKECVETTSPTWKKLLEHRHKFLSAKCFHTFTGYAISQLKRIRGHRSWLLTPPTHKPTREEFGLGESGQGVRELARGIDISTISPEATQIIEKEKRYKSALTKWSQYENWKKTRNPARAKLEAQFGFDTKHAMHLIRLLRSGEEILVTGKLTVRRVDAQNLLDIRKGVYTYDEIVREAELRKQRLEDIYNKKRYVVPHKAPVEELSDLCAELHEFHWNQAT